MFEIFVNDVKNESFNVFILFMFSSCYLFIFMYSIILKYISILLYNVIRICTYTAEVFYSRDGQFLHSI
jgi:hypothetical protein